MVVTDLLFQKGQYVQGPLSHLLSCLQRHVPLQYLTEAFMGQIRRVWWLPLAEVMPRAGYWLTARASSWAAGTSLPQTLHQQGPSSETSCWTGLIQGSRRKETITKFLPSSLKKKTRTFFGGVDNHTQGYDRKIPSETQLIYAVERQWILLVRSNEEAVRRGPLGGWCGPCLHRGAGDLGVLFVKILQAVHLTAPVPFCMYVRILDQNLKVKVGDG